MSIPPLSPIPGKRPAEDEDLRRSESPESPTQKRIKKIKTSPSSDSIASPTNKVKDIANQKLEQSPETTEHQILTRTFSTSSTEETLKIGTLKFPNAAQYVGQLKEDNTPHGDGKWTKSHAKGFQESEYSGNWVDGKREGYGKLTFADGSQYVGNFQNNKYHGEGKLLRVEGGTEKTYKGIFDSGKFLNGTLLMDIGSRYVGDFKDFLPHGKCSYLFPKAQVNEMYEYQGNWNKGRMEGYGKRIMGNGAEYIGEFRNDLPHGQCTYRNINATGFDLAEYDGNWVNGIREGQGTILLANGIMYEGGFVNGRFHGRGKLTDPREGINIVAEYEGDYVNGARQGQGRMVKANGVCFIGEFQNNIPHGKTKRINPHAKGFQEAEFEGLYANGQKVIGRSVLANGTKYEGEFKNDNYHGKGKLTTTSQDGQVVEYEGIWENGRQVEGKNILRGQVNFDANAPHEYVIAPDEG